MCASTDGKEDQEMDVYTYEGKIHISCSEGKMIFVLICYNGAITLFLFTVALFLEIFRERGLRRE